MQVELSGRVQRYRALRAGVALSHEDFVGRLDEDPDLRAQLTQVIRDCPFDAVFWECAPVGAANRQDAFEFVLVDAPALARVAPRPEPFAAHFDGAASVAVFPSLGRDAVLVAPAPAGPAGAYPHLSAFLRRAPVEQVDRLWCVVASAVRDWWDDGASPMWLSTSGLGVHWLHIRLDSRPKYYTWAAYRKPPGR